MKNNYVVTHTYADPKDAKDLHEILDRNIRLWYDVVPKKPDGNEKKSPTPTTSRAEVCKISSEILC